MAEEEVKVPELEKAEIPWMVAYLREDIQDLRNEIRELRRGMDRRFEQVVQRFEQVDRRLDALHREMGVQFRWLIGIVIGAMLAMTGVFAWIVDRMLTP